ncbi:hypothetical protein HOC80_01750 [archaeon]|jgi:hypothetical protein|nr:hypothetical protein [archaeon]MBT4416805.1 hypothetical protein [archaeon]
MAYKPKICNSCKGYETEGCYIAELEAIPGHNPDMIVSKNNVLRRCTSESVEENVRILRDTQSLVDRMGDEVDRLKGYQEGTLELGVYESEPRDPTK